MSDERAIFSRSLSPLFYQPPLFNYAELLAFRSFAATGAAAF